MNPPWVEYVNGNIKQVHRDLVEFLKTDYFIQIFNTNWHEYKKSQLIYDIIVPIWKINSWITWEVSYAIGYSLISQLDLYHSFKQPYISTYDFHGLVFHRKYR